MKVEEIKKGNSLKIKLPAIGTRKPILCHFEEPIENPISEHNDCTLIVLRYWMKRKKRWDFKIYLYWELALWNDWACKFLEDEV